MLHAFRDVSMLAAAGPGPLIPAKMRRLHHCLSARGAKSLVPVTFILFTLDSLAALAVAPIVAFVAWWLWRRSPTRPHRGP